MQHHILLVEDDADIAQVVRLYFEREGFVLSHASDGESALDMMNRRAVDPSLAVLDINLPGIDGFVVLEWLRRRSDIPVIMLTARRADNDALHGLESGADEYVTKPFSPRVLVARVKAHLRRAAHGGGAKVLCGQLAIDLKQERVQFGDREIALAPREFALLEYLVGREGSPASAEEIYGAVWGHSYGDLSSVAVHIGRLRRKIEPDSKHPQFIKTRVGYGYYFACGGDQ